MIKETKRKKQIEQKLKAFRGIERWEKAAGNMKKQRKGNIFNQSREFLINKYKAKFPSEHNEPSRQLETIRL